ncbi:MAG: hypothetical protein E6405_07930 [Clostridium botulinum]|jgi:hypothetical protein|nr:hypothetical protein [Clostridium botulinum]
MGILKFVKWETAFSFHFEEDKSIRVGNYRIKYDRSLFKIDLILI